MPIYVLWGVYPLRRRPEPKGLKKCISVKLKNYHPLFLKGVNHFWVWNFFPQVFDTNLELNIPNNRVALYFLESMTNLWKITIPSFEKFTQVLTISNKHFLRCLWHLETQHGEGVLHRLVLNLVLSQSWLGRSWGCPGLGFPRPMAVAVGGHPLA